MAISNDERREVAARLREVWASGCTFVSFFEFDCDDFETCQECSKCCGNRLADLIEPEPERTCELIKHAALDEESGIELVLYECGQCGWIVDPSRNERYCPNCGIRVRRDDE